MRRGAVRRALVLGALAALSARHASAQATSISAVSCSPARATPKPPALRWRGTTVRWAEWPVQLGAARVRNTLIVVLVDPARVAISLDIARRGNALAPWSIEVAP